MPSERKTIYVAINEDGEFFPSEIDGATAGEYLTEQGYGGVPWHVVEVEVDIPLPERPRVTGRCEKEPYDAE